MLLLERLELQIEPISKDYKNAINQNTKLILSVHTSNYIIKGYTKSVGLGDLVSLGREHDVQVMADWGSGSLLKSILAILL